MNNGFVIKRLWLTGPDAKPAIVTFTKGLNVISGPSQTGKTFIFQCINYMLGGSAKPKNIREARSYSHCHIELQSGNDLFELISDLKGGNFELLQRSTLPDENETLRYTLYRKHNDLDTDNVSQLLLSLCNLSNKKLKENAIGKKRGLSYRDLTKFLMVDETKIITDKSPILSGQYTTGTVEKSCFRLILTGNDDSDIIEKLSTKEVTHRKGKLEMLSDLIISIQKEIDELQVVDEPGRLDKIETSISNTNYSLASIDAVNLQLNERRNTLELQFFAERTKVDELSLISSRSTILMAQYNSDQDRVVSTIEACQLLRTQEDDPAICPVCHSPLDGQLPATSIDEIENSCKTELYKIELLKNDLIESKKLLLDEINTAIDNTTALSVSLQAINTEIEEKVQNRIKTLMGELAGLQEVRGLLNKHSLLVTRKETLIASRDSIARSISVNKKQAIDSDNLSSVIFPLTEQMKEILEACHYPSLKAVSFNEEKMDFIISGEDRELSGKGFRAITYSSFIVALQKLIKNADYSLGVPVLDSPLVTYRKPTAGDEGIEIDLAMDFYRYLAYSDIDQIIIMENEEPPADIETKINHIVFTQSLTTGRYGFIPTP